MDKKFHCSWWLRVSVRTTTLYFWSEMFNLTARAWRRMSYCSLTAPHHHTKQRSCLIEKRPSFLVQRNQQLAWMESIQSLGTDHCLENTPAHSPGGSPQRTVGCRTVGSWFQILVVPVPLLPFQMCKCKRFLGGTMFQEKTWCEKGNAFCTLGP